MCNSQALCFSPGQIPQVLGRASHGVEALGALTKLGFVKCDLHGDDLVSRLRGRRARSCQGIDSTTSSTVFSRSPVFSS